MMQTITHVYDSYDQARHVVDALEDAGFSSDEISLVANRHVSAEHADVDETSETAAGAGIGAAIGGGAGLLAGLGLLAIPGLGPVVAAGWLASTAVGAVAGGATGGLVGALIEHGTSEEEAHIYSETVRRGGTMVSVRVEDDKVAEARAILNRYKPIDLQTRAAEYRAAGWERFDPDAPAYTPTEAELERIRSRYPT